MERQTLKINGISMNVYSLNTIIVGSGCAGFNAADSLYSLGQRDIAIITEGQKMGTSRNTGSDKQTYYKLNLAGAEQDSILDMARTLFDGGCMHGDIALVEAALSTRNFYKLVELGVPFPYNDYGEYVGYKTDHDPRQRATSAGPLTSKYMTECLENKVIEKGIKIFDGYLVIGILTTKYKVPNNDNSHSYKSDSSDLKAIGLITMNLNELRDSNDHAGITLFNCTNIIYATGGPAGIYSTSVYPESQSGATGIAFEAGVKGVNLTEWQYGIASTKFRWNLSGTYQQVLPRYVSTDINGLDEKEFLQEYFPDPGKMLDAIFLKGYQWPFDPRKIENYGSSLIDILVYNEIHIKGRRVFLDYTRNPSCKDFKNIKTKHNDLDFSLLETESYEYLNNSQALFGTPIQRLAKMNSPAIELYRNNGIDLEKEYLEISVCAQHNNGGLVSNMWWESNVKNFFPVGEVSGTFGVYRPGGSALNSTQTGSFRAAQYISRNYMDSPLNMDEFIRKAEEQIKNKIRFTQRIVSGKTKESCSNVFEIRKKMQERMTACGGHIRKYNEIIKAMNIVKEELKDMARISTISSIQELPEVFKNYDIAVTQYVYLNAMKEYIEKGGKSRGSYLIYDDNGKLPIKELPELYRFSLNVKNNYNFAKIINEIQIIKMQVENGYIDIFTEWKPVRPIPKNNYWFETVWDEFRKHR